MAGMNKQAFGWPEVALNNFAREIEPNGSGTRDFLENETLAAEKAST